MSQWLDVLGEDLDETERLEKEEKEMMERLKKEEEEEAKQMSDLYTSEEPLGNGEVEEDGEEEKTGGATATAADVLEGATAAGPGGDEGKMKSAEEGPPPNLLDMFKIILDQAHKSGEPVALESLGGVDYTQFKYSVDDRDFDSAAEGEAWASAAANGDSYFAPWPDNLFLFNKMPLRTTLLHFQADGKWSDIAAEGGVVGRISLESLMATAPGMNRVNPKSELHMLPVKAKFRKWSNKDMPVETYMALGSQIFDKKSQKNQTLIWTRARRGMPIVTPSVPEAFMGKDAGGPLLPPMSDSATQQRATFIEEKEAMDENMLIFKADDLLWLPTFSRWGLTNFESLKNLVFVPEKTHPAPGLVAIPAPSPISTSEFTREQWFVMAFMPMFALGLKQWTKGINIDGKPAAQAPSQEEKEKASQEKSSTPRVFQRVRGGKFRFVFPLATWIWLMDSLRNVFRFKAAMNLSNGLRLAWLSCASQEKHKDLASSSQILVNTTAEVRLTYYAITKEMLDEDDSPEPPIYEGAMDVAGCACVRFHSDAGPRAPKAVAAGTDVSVSGCAATVAGGGKLCHTGKS